MMTKEMHTDASVDIASSISTGEGRGNSRRASQRQGVGINANRRSGRALLKLTISAMLISIGLLGSYFPVFVFPIGPAKCAPLQHLINVVAAVLLGPGYAVAVAFGISLLRNLFGLGTLLAFPGSMVGAFLAGSLFLFSRKARLNISIGVALASVGEALGTGLLGAILAFPVAKWLLGNSTVSATFFILPFMVSSAVGAVLAFGLIHILMKARVISIGQIQSDHKSGSTSQEDPKAATHSPHQQ